MKLQVKNVTVKPMLSLWELLKRQFKRDKYTRRRLVSDGYRTEFMLKTRGTEKPELVEQRERERKQRPFGKLLGGLLFGREQELGLLKLVRGEQT